MNRYAVTFGSQYGTLENQEIHPTAPVLDRDSFVQIEAPSYEVAHATAMRVFEGCFAFLYAFESFSSQIREYGLTDKTTELLSYFAQAGKILTGNLESCTTCKGAGVIYQPQPDGGTRPTTCPTCKGAGTVSL